MRATLELIRPAHHASTPPTAVPPRPHRDCGRNEHPPDPDNITLDGESSSRGGVKMAVKNAKRSNPNCTPPTLMHMYKHAIQKCIDIVQLNRGPTTAIHGEISMVILINGQLKKQAGYRKSQTGSLAGVESLKDVHPTTYVSDNPRT